MPIAFISMTGKATGRLVTIVTVSGVNAQSPDYALVCLKDKISDTDNAF